MIKKRMWAILLFCLMVTSVSAANSWNYGGFDSETGIFQITGMAVNVPENPLFHLTFDDSIEDGKATDSSGNGFHGYCEGNKCPVREDGIIGDAYWFDGTNDILDLGSDAGLDNLGPYTISLWVYPDASANGYVIGKRKANCAGPWRVALYNKHLEWFDKRSESGPGFTAWEVLSENEWNHIVISWGGGTSTESMAAYVNGNSVSLDAFPGVGNFASDASCRLAIGARNVASSFFEGGLTK